MTLIDYTLLDAPKIRLSLVRSGNGYIVWDQACRFYILAPCSLTFCLEFLRAGADRGDWLIDDASIERATWDAAQHSVRVGALPEEGLIATSRTEASALAGPARSQVASAVKGAPGPSSGSANVFPLFHDHLDETA